MINKRWRWIAPLLATTAVVAGVLVPSTQAAARGTAACPDGVQVAQHVVAGSMVGETHCAILSQEPQVDGRGRPWVQTDIGFDGTAAGYADPVTVGNTRKDLTDTPTTLFPQFGIPTWEKGVGTYSGTAPVAGNAASDTGLSVLYPANRADWDRSGDRVVFAMHGQSENTPIGALIPQPRKPGQQLADTPPGTFGNLFADEWINAGYAVVYVRRPASNGVPTVMADGTHLDESLNDNIAFGLDMLASGERYLTSVLHQAPTQVLGYGHSAGTIWLRELNYSGLNTVAGKHLIAGIFSDDPGGGLPLPLSMPQGQVLGERGSVATFPASALLRHATVAQMVPEITLAHQLYQSYHTWAPTVRYSDFKLMAPELYRREGAQNLTRTYELAGVSHISNQAGSPPMTLDYGDLASGLMSVLSNWVNHGRVPAATLANQPGRDVTSQMLLTAATGCPTGIRYPWPTPDGAPSETGYVAYGSGLEPVNSQGMLVDVSRLGDLSGGNGVRDALPTMVSVWRARHLPLTRSGAPDMVACVRGVSANLVAHYGVSDAAAAVMVAQAKQFPTAVFW